MTILKKRLIYLCIFIVVLSILLSPLINHLFQRFAKSRCGVDDTSPERAQVVAESASHLTKWLNNTGENLVVIARRGQDLTQYGIEFSHVAYAKKEGKAWMIYHLLNICPTNQGKLATETLIDFLKAIPAKQRVAVVIPNRVMQEKLALILDDKVAKESLFEPNYNAIAYPFSTINQNSNGWILEIFAKAASTPPITNRIEAIRWLKANHYIPEIIQTNIIRKFLMTTLIPNMSDEGHLKGHLRNNRFLIDSSDSTLNFIARYGITPKACVNDVERLNHNICIISP